jgi:hypothetical protein
MATHNIVNSTDVTQSPGNNTTLVATTAFVTAAVSAGAGIAFPGYITGNLYAASGFFANVLQTAADQALTTGSLFLFPYYNWSTHTYTALSMICGTLASSSNLNLGIYANANGAPTGSPLFTSGSISTATTGTKSYTTSLALTGNTWYWLAASNSSSTPLFRSQYGPNSAYLSTQIPLGQASIPAASSGSNQVVSYSMTFVYSATLPTISGLTPLASAITPIIFLTA